MIYLKRILSLILVSVLLLTLCACGNSGQADSGKIKIIATNFPLYDFARQIAGDRADITMLIPPGSEVHSFEPTPKQIIEIGECDLFLYIGGESDKWVDTLLSSNPIKGTELSLIGKVEIIETGHQHEGEHSHIADEHIWTSPKNALKMVNTIAQELCSVDSDGKDIYIANAASYTENLNSLDNSLKEISAKSKRKTLVFGDRFPFAYLARDYGFDYIAAYPGCYNNTEPGAATVAAIAKRVRDESIPYIFYIEFSNQRIATAISQESGARLLRLHSCHNVSAQDFQNKVTYFDLMSANIKNLERALS